MIIKNPNLGFTTTPGNNTVQPELHSDVENSQSESSNVKNSQPESSKVSDNKSIDITPSSNKTIVKDIIQSIESDVDKPSQKGRIKVAIRKDIGDVLPASKLTPTLESKTETNKHNSPRAQWSKPKTLTFDAMKETTADSEKLQHLIG